MSRRLRVRIRTSIVTTAAMVTILAMIVPARATFPDQGNLVLFGRVIGAPVRGSGAVDLFTMRSNGDDQHRVIRTEVLAEYAGHWSPDGSQIVFLGSTGKGSVDIYTADANGTHRDAIATTASNYSPNWSRNGEQIVWTRFSGPPTLDHRSGMPVLRRGGSANLMVMDADGRNKHSIFSGLALSPGWSPSAGRIAFSTTDADSLDIWRVKPNGLGLQQFTDYGVGSSAVFGDWAPNGGSFAFTWSPPTVRGTSSYSLYVAPTSNPTDTILLASNVEAAFAPVFTGDGDRVIFVRDDGTDLELFSVKSSGGGLQQLTTNAADDFLTLIPLL